MFTDPKEAEARTLEIIDRDPYTQPAREAKKGTLDLQNPNEGQSRDRYLPKKSTTAGNNDCFSIVPLFSEDRQEGAGKAWQLATEEIKKYKTNMRLIRTEKTLRPRELNSRPKLVLPYAKCTNNGGYWMQQ